MSQVHRAVHVADQVDQHPQGRLLLPGFETPAFELRGQIGYGPQDIPFGETFGGFDLSVRGDIEVVPRLRMGIQGRMAGIVHPVGDIDRREPVQYAPHLSGRLPGEMLLGNGGRDVVSLLSPTESSAGNNQPQHYCNQLLHRCFRTLAFSSCLPTLLSFSPSLLLSGPFRTNGSSWRGTPRSYRSGPSAFGGTPWPRRASCPRGICAAPTCGSSRRAAAAGLRGAYPTQ